MKTVALPKPIECAYCNADLVHLDVECTATLLHERKNIHLLNSGEVVGLAADICINLTCPVCGDVLYDSVATPGLTFEPA